MDNLVIAEVSTQKHKNDFYALPKFIYKYDKNYIAPLLSDTKKVFDTEKNEYYQYGEATQFVVYANEQCVGRIAAFYWKDNKDQTIGGCGFFESINSQEVANLLFDSSVTWLKNKGASFMDGPVNFGSRDSFWGLFISSTTYTSYRENYHLPYYQELFLNYGFTLQIEQSTYEINPDMFDKKRFDMLASRVMTNPKFTFEYFDFNQLEKFAGYFVEIYNKAWAFHDDFKPMERAKLNKALKSFKPVLCPEFCVFALADGKPAGMYLSILEVNQVFKDFNGKLNLINKIKFLLRRSKIDKIRGIIFGLIPEVHNTGIEVGMIMKMYDSVTQSKSVHNAELSWIGDFNPKMHGMLEKLGAVKTKIHHTLRYTF